VRLELNQCSYTPVRPIANPVEIQQVDLSVYDLILAGGEPA